MYLNKSTTVKIQNSLNGRTEVRTADKTYPILNISSLKKSDDGYYRYIYYIFDHKTNKYYIGQHRTFSLEMDDYAGSGSKILNEYENAKSELGDEWESRFTKCVIANALSEEELEFLEKKIVSKKVLSDIMSYNMVVGGSRGYKGYNSTPVFVYNADGTLVERFKSINQAATWAEKNANTKGSLSNIVSSMARLIKSEKYKLFGLYFVDYEINDWNMFIEGLKTSKHKTKVMKNTPVVLIDKTDKSRNMFKNRKEAARWIISNGFSNTDSVKQVVKTVDKAIHENRYAYGFIIKYVNVHAVKSVKMGTSLFKSNAQVSSLVGLVNKYNSIFEFGKENFTVELDERTFELMLSSVTMYNIQHNVATSVNDLRTEFSFMGLRFRKTSGDPRIVIENCLNFSPCRNIPADTEEELCGLCSALSSISGISVVSSSSGHYGDEGGRRPGVFYILLRCSNMGSMKMIMDSMAKYDRRHSEDETASRTRYELVDGSKLQDVDLQMDEYAFRLTNSSFNTVPRIERLKRYSEIVELLG